MLPAELATIEELIGQAAIMIASLAIAVYSIAGPRLPDFRKKLRDRKTEQISELERRRARLHQGVPSSEKEISEITERIKACQDEIDRLDTLLPNLSLGQLVYGPCIFSAISFLLSLNAISLSSTLGLESAEKAAGAIQSLWGSLIFCGLSFVLVIYSLKNIQRTIDMAEEKKYGRFLGTYSVGGSTFKLRELPKNHRETI